MGRLADKSRRVLAAMLSSRDSRMVPQYELASNAGPIEPAAMQASVAEAAATTALSTTTIIGIVVGSCILVASTVLIALILHKRAAHKRAMAAMEEGGQQTVRTAQSAQVGDCSRPTLYARKPSLLPMNVKAGWGALSSSEKICEPDLAGHPSRKPKRASISLPKRAKKKGGIRLKYMSAIIESPRSRSVQSPALVRPQTSGLGSGSGAAARVVPAGDGEARKTSVADDGDVFAGPGSPKPHVLPSFAIRSPGRYGALFAAEDNPKAIRSWSVGAFVPAAAKTSSLKEAPLQARPLMHARSMSLGAHRMSSLPPTGPVPPLPVIAPHDPKLIDARQGVCVSRLSTSSSGSGSSSVLVTSPLLRGPETSEATQSPSLEQIVADDDAASLKTVSHKQWQNPLIAGPRAAASSSLALPHTVTHKASIRSHLARYSTDSALTRHLSTSTASSLDNTATNRLSIPHLATADRISISRVSSTNSLKSTSPSTTSGVVKKVHTPRKPPRSTSTSVSASGSPAERRRPLGVLRDISGNACAPSRNASSATQNSARSSNGDPFQWDSKPLLKPSALKGSPNARKGHRRQNCVRISTLTPQILGPPPSRPTSPSIMRGIQESPDENEGDEMEVHGLPFVVPKRSSWVGGTGNLRIQTLRASLTPSSPTLSAWNTFQRHGLPSQVSDSQLSGTGSSPGRRFSGQSSVTSIPAFPSPSKTTVAAVQLAQPVPEFHFTRPSTDEPEWSSSPRGDGDVSPLFDLHLEDEAEMPSSPPLPVSKELEYDPAWPGLSVPVAHTGAQEYDPASPAIVWDTSPGAEHSSPFQASTVIFSDEEEPDSPLSRPTSYLQQKQQQRDRQPSDSPPCSPKTMPEGFAAFFSGTGSSKPSSVASPPRAPTTTATQEAKESAESKPSPLTSANASTRLDLSTAPILRPPSDYSPIPYLPSPSHASVIPPVPAFPSFSPHRPAPSPPSQLSPLGPRPPPSKSVLQTTMALRRMNSEIDTSTNRQSRRYIHGLTREPSPLLPWIGSPDLCEEGDVAGRTFDFDFAAAARAPEDGFDEVAGALDEIDICDLECRLEGALGGFDVPVELDEVREEDEMAVETGSVWEDGEKFWHRTSLSTIPGSSPEARMTPVGVKNAATAAAGGEGVFGKISPVRFSFGGGGFSGFGGRERPVSTVMATPRSLYDADGFLRSEGC